MKLNEDFTAPPKLRDIGRWYVTQFVKNVAHALPPGTRLLDAGAGECAYKRFFSGARYLSVDAAIGNPSWNYHNLDCISALDRLPFQEQSFDAVLCTQTLEHLEWPRESVQELFRVLKPGGTLYLTAPMAHHEHQAPHDFFRYTSYGLESICRKAGFTTVQITPFCGTFTRLAYQVARVLSVFPTRALLLLPIRLLQQLLLGLDCLDRKRDYPLGWGVTAQKGSPT